jgi:hypothetical protein
MTKDTAYLWPADCSLIVRDEHGVELFRSSDRRFDLADNVMSRNFSERKVIIAFQIDSWQPDSSETEASRLENLITYDFEFDGYLVSLSRLEETIADTYAWQVQIQPAM